METAANAEAALPPRGDETGAEHRVTLTASTDPHKALADIAQLRAESTRRSHWRIASQVLFVLGAMLAGWMTPRFREHGMAAAPATDVAPVLAPAASASPVESSPPVVPVDTQQVIAPVVAAPEDPAERCEHDFKLRTWRAALESCSAAFDAAPSPTLAMRVAHARFSHGDTSGAGAWASNALELGSTDPDAHLLIGNAELAAGKRRKAMAAYREYLELAPRGWHAARLRKLID